MSMRDEMIAHVRERGALATDEEAERVLARVVQVLAERLEADEASSLASALPPALAERVRSAPRRRDLDVAGFFERVAAGEGTRVGFGREHAIVACQAIAAALPDEARLRLIRHLGPEWDALLARDAHDPVDVPPHGVRHHADPDRSLAGGRPGGRHPLAESRPERAHAESVARSDEPHRDTKLSSSRGTTQEREHETIAEATGDLEREVATTRRSV